MFWFQYVFNFLRLLYSVLGFFSYIRVDSILLSKLLQVNVLMKYHQDAKGGILLSQINECIPNADKVLEVVCWWFFFYFINFQAAGKEVIVVNTNVNKRKDKVAFWNDPGYDFELDEEYKALWRSISVDHLDEKKIEEYLQKHGIEAMKVRDFFHFHVTSTFRIWLQKRLQMFPREKRPSDASMEKFTTSISAMFYKTTSDLSTLRDIINTGLLFHLYMNIFLSTLFHIF